MKFSTLAASFVAALTLGSAVAQTSNAPGVVSGEIRQPARVEQVTGTPTVPQAGKHKARGLNKAKNGVKAGKHANKRGSKGKRGKSVKPSTLR